MPPEQRREPVGCPFAPRCAWRIPACWTTNPPLRPVASSPAEDADHQVACHNPPTLEEADACRRDGITITTFMIATDSYLVAFVDKLTKINRGRAYYASPYNLAEFLFTDYIRNRKKFVH